MQKKIGVFGSGKSGPGNPIYKTAHELGTLVAKAGFIHVSGGYGGTMEAGASGAREAGGETIGVIISGWGAPNPYISQVIRTHDLFERIGKLMEISDGYIVLPGATGTLIELAMAWERNNKGLDQVKPIVLVGDFWKPVIEVVKSQLMSTIDTQTKDAKCLFGNFLWMAKTPAEAVAIIREFL